MYLYQRWKASFTETRNCDLLKAINAHAPLLNPVRFFHWVHTPQAKSWFYFPVSWSFPCWSWPRDFLFESTLTSRNHRPELLKGLFERQKQNYALFVCLRLLKKNFFLCEAMRAALSQVIVKRPGGAISVLRAFSDSRVSGGGEDKLPFTGVRYGGSPWPEILGSEFFSTETSLWQNSSCWGLLPHQGRFLTSQIRYCLCG